MDQRNYILEYSNAEHPKLVKLQDGSSSIDFLLPLANFVEICNASRKLINGKDEMVTFTSIIYTDIDDMNKYLRLCARMNDQMGNFFLELKKKGAPLYVPDPNYFNTQLQNTKKAISSGRLDRDTGALNLNREFTKVLNDAIDRNERTASRYGVKLPYSKDKEIQK